MGQFKEKVADWRPVGNGFSGIRMRVSQTIHPNTKRTPIKIGVSFPLLGRLRKQVTIGPNVARQWEERRKPARDSQAEQQATRPAGRRVGSQAARQASRQASRHARHRATTTQQTKRNTQLCLQRKDRVLQQGFPSAKAALVQPSARLNRAIKTA